MSGQVILLLVTFGGCCLVGVALRPIRLYVRVTTRRRVRDALAHVTLPPLFPLDQPDSTLGIGQPPTTDSVSPRVLSGVVPAVSSSDSLLPPRMHLDEAAASHRRTA